MNIPKAIRRIKYVLFDKKHQEAARRRRFITDVVNTRVFSRMSLPNQVLSLGRLITMFRNDYGYTPRPLERTFDALNRKASALVKETWTELYSVPA